MSYEGEQMGKVNRRAASGVLALVLAIVVLAGACSSSGDSSATSETDAPSESSAVNRDGTLKLGFDMTGNGTFTWEPGFNTSHSSMDPLWYFVYGRLMRATEDGSFVPDLAESVTVVDANTIEIKVRPGQTWHDGAPFDAASVKAGLDHNLATEPASSGFTEPFYAPEGGVSVVDDTTVQIKFPGGTAASWYDSFIAAPPTTITRPGTYSGTPIGAGPMKATQYSPDTSLSMERFDDYWNADQVGFAGIDIVHIDNGSPQSSTAALQSDQADVVTFDTTQLAALSGALKPATVSDPTRLMRMGLCKRDAPLDNENIRKAISKAIDRDALNEVVFAGTAEKAVQLWPEDNRFFNPELGDELDYDPEAAKQLVADSGVANPKFDLYILDNLGLPDTATIVEAQLAEVGIEANLIITPDLPGQFLVPQAPGATIFPATQNAGLLKLKDFNGIGASNLCSWADPAIQALFDQISQVSSDTDEAQQAWWDVQQIYADETLGVPLLFGSVVGGYNSDRLVMGGVYPGGLYVVPDIYNSSMAG
ncbi:MAG TPA: ABC transporter substrate-binding protein [Acidimicrobiales bacterium]